MGKQIGSDPQTANFGVGNNFVSVNLNKSYGQQPSKHPYHSHYSGSYGANRGRTTAGGRGGGGMVVLSRPRSSQKAASKLSVPPPLNLPSLRKEHERFDSLGPGGMPASGGMSGNGPRPTSSGMGWVKPVTVALQEKEGCHGHHVNAGVDRGLNFDDGISRGNHGVYVPPSARPSVTGPTASASALGKGFPPLDKATVLQGEDFPSLQAALPIVSGTEKKHKDSLNQKRKPLATEELSNEQWDGSRSSSVIDTPSQLQSGRIAVGNRLSENGSEGHGVNGSRLLEQGRKADDYFPVPLPLVHLNPRSDWADDERDTGQGFTDRGRDHGYPKNKAYWDSDFDVPSAGVLPHRPSHSLFDKRRQNGNETGQTPSTEITKVDPGSRDAKIPSREGKGKNSRRASSPLPKEKIGCHETASHTDTFGSWPSSVNREKENKYISSPLRDNAGDDIGRRDAGYRSVGRHAWNNATDSFSSRVSEWNARDHYGNEQYNRYKVDALQDSSLSKSSFSYGGKRLPVNDPILNFGREKKPLPKNERRYLEDPFMNDFGGTGFNGRDPFAGNIVGVIKRKIDVCKPTDIYDPVRESFEAELERVQNMQEQERKRIVEQQERALEQARREEEDRLQLAREQEEQRRRLEEEARETAWRAEQEQLEALRSVEEQRTTREEEKRRILMEEERRKQSAKQKLLELEERIAKRQAEAGKSVSNVSAGADAFTGQETENGSHSPRQDGSIMGRPYGAAPYISSRPYYKPGALEPHIDDFGQPKVQSWNVSADGDCYGRNTEIESEYHAHLAGNYGDVTQGQHCHGHIYPPYLEGFYNNNEGNGLFSSGRSRYSVRQPRVLPTPSLSSMQKTLYRGENEHPGSSTFLENETQYTHTRRGGFAMDGVYDSGHQDDLGQLRIIDPQTENADNEAQKVDDSQSSLSVSSPPDSPTHISHDDLDEFGDSTIFSVEEGKEVELSGQGMEPLTTEAEKENVQIASNSVSVIEDDEWPIDNNDQLLDQEEYDEDEDGYEEEDEVHEEDDGSIDLTPEFNEMHLEDNESPYIMDNLVLGFNEGLEVGITNDEFDKSSRQEDSAYTITHSSFDGINTDTKSLQTMGSPSQGSLDSSRLFEETKKPMQNLVFQPTADPQSKCELMGNVDATGSSSELAEHTLLYSAVTASPSSSGLSGMPTDYVPNQAEEPVKLQFGLFSGPPLIPSPVPAIQIGSMPLNLHPQVQVGQCPGQMHSSQPLLFQFGQLRYTSPISHGVLPLAPQSVSFVYPNVSANLSLNQNPGVPVQQSGQDTSMHNIIKTEVLSLPDNQSGLPRSWDISHGNVLKEGGSVPARESRKRVVPQHGLAEMLNIADNTIRSRSCFLSEDQRHQNSVSRNPKALSGKQAEGDNENVLASSQSVPKEKYLSGLRGQTYSNRGKKFVFMVKGPRSAFLASEASCQESSGYQRRARRPQKEFVSRENSDKKPSSGIVSSNQMSQVVQDEKSSANGCSGFSTRKGVRKVGVNKLKQTVQSECSTSVLGSYREINSGNRNGNELGKESLMCQSVPNSEGSNLKRNIGEDVVAPIESGIVRVFEQPGIEVASDKDDFIEVRSKRQMLNDRREQRENEIKAKSWVAKPPRRPRSIPKRSAVSTNSNRSSPSSRGKEMKSFCPDFVTTEGCKLSNYELSAGFVATLVTQPLVPIGTPAIKSDAQTDIRMQALKSLQTSSLPTTSGSGLNLVSAFMSESKNKVLDNVQTSLGSWGNSYPDQQVLNQVQPDDALKSVQVNTCAPSGDHTSSVTDPSMPSLSIFLKDKSFPSAASPISSLLAGEKIQFGAVTSPTVLPSGNRVISHGIGPPGSSQTEIQISHNRSAAENDCTIFFERKKHSSESCARLEGCDAAAKAAASSVAVAAITSAETVGNGKSTCTVSASDDKGFGGAEVDVISAGGAIRQLASQSKAEESLSVSLPADLSIENPAISLWPPLPSPQNSSSQMISHFPGGLPSQFPFYEMNPMMGTPIYDFGPHEESSSTQSQSQKSSTAASGPLGTWQQCHSGVDSFYGPPTGFTGHFISPPGGIPGIQGPPHMFVYNHFAPVGQFGLSFMGTTYIPSGKQPDWKHNPDSSSTGEGYLNNSNTAASQHNASNMPAQIGHLAAGPVSPLPPMASQLAMFDVSPFQSTPDMSVQGRWSHVHASPLQPAVPSLSLQQQAEGVLPSQFSQGRSIDKSLASNRFPESQTSTPSDSNPKYPVNSELGFVEQSSSTIAAAASAHGSSLTKNADIGNTGVQNVGGIESGYQKSNSGVKTPSSPQKNITSQNYSHQRGSGGVSQKNDSGEWSHRRMGFQGRNQSIGGDKYVKLKQIYVAKQTSNGTST
ncbi:putative DNA binding protein [Hibiscus syriacus]|uniref:DNA binding protein n=1 Tax=Hibiscus syriacus TaxID=106335 RepID=A0A6A2WGS4_HIBSY|nr:uncharacterized protein LOC120196799 [Hibiscus syriacus]KAE8655155.1 putative DNA binding protein [Hibiscus syriacus]